MKGLTEYAELTGLFKQEMAGKIAEEQKFPDSARSSRNYETTSLKHKGTASVDNLLSAKYNFRTIKGKHKGEPLRTLLNEISAKEYILAKAKMYKVPRKEVELIKKQLENYKQQLKEFYQEIK